MLIAAARPMLAAITAGMLTLTGCANTPMNEFAVAPSNCDTNAGFAMTGVTHAATKRDYDECRQLLARQPSHVVISQSTTAP